MTRNASVQPTRNRGLRVLATLLMIAVLALSGYASYTVYGLVRESISRSLNLPSFSVLSQQMGLPSIPQPSNLSVLSPLPAPPSEAMPSESNTANQPEERQASEEILQERINILVMGIDQRPGEAGPFRTDTMIVFTVDPKTGVAGMFSIPRDLWVPVPGYAENRINTAHFLGDLRKYPGGGPALAMKTVSYNFGFPIHYYVRLNFEGFKQVVDMIGGVVIEVPKEINDQQYPDEQYGYEPLFIPAGLIHMDGDLALKYARTRKTDSDFHRAHRQQQVILAIKDRIFSLNLLPSLLVKLPELTRILSDAIQTDIPLDEMIRLAKLARTMDLSNIKTVVIDETMTIPNVTPSGAQVLLPIRERIRPIVDDLFWTPLPTIPPSS